MVQTFQGKFIPGLYDGLAQHAAGRVPYNLHGLGRVSCGLDLYYSAQILRNIS